jgi:acyl-CoA reductase-like NAD-dependent aldehyde dehydrogenase
MAVKTVNPYTDETIAEYKEDGWDEIAAKLSQLKASQRKWGRDLHGRIEALKESKKRFSASVDDLARQVTSEMGKPITQSLSEVTKSIQLLDYAIEHAESFLAPEQVKTEAKRSYIRFEPLGTILAIEPWNYPVQQAMRAAVWALAAGNAVLLKHSSIVSGTSKKLEELFGLDVFKSTICGGDTALSIIGHVDGVAFTGSDRTGSRIAAEAGKNLKKAVLELGGSDPFIVIDGTGLDKTVESAVSSRLTNAGQICISAKRFIVHADVYDEFYSKLKEGFAKVKAGDPLDSGTFIGPLSSRNQAQTVREQIQRLGKIGKVEEALTGLHGNFVPPTVVRTDVLFDEEVFGPVAILKKYETDEEAVSLANETPYGLGASVWGDSDAAERLAPRIEAGMVFINKRVTSDPRLPFGGVKRSGVGRELSRYGMLELTNMKSVWVD